MGIILATAGSAVGLGNIWRFPVETGSNGGAAFIIIYLACVLILGIPMMTAEFIIGRRTHTNIASAYQQLAPGEPWFLTGYAGMLCVTLILSYYSVVAGWTLKYAVSSALTEMSTVSDTAAYFTDFASSTCSPLCYSIIFLLIFTVLLNILLDVIGMKTISRLLLSNSVFQPVLAALIGLIPNCAASVMLTQLYIDGIISFGSAVAGLCSAAGLGLVVLFRMNDRHKKENVGIVALLYGIAVLSGIILQAVM